MSTNILLPSGIEAGRYWNGREDRFHVEGSLSVDDIRALAALVEGSARETWTHKTEPGDAIIVRTARGTLAVCPLDGSPTTIVDEDGVFRVCNGDHRWEKGEE